MVHHAASPDGPPASNLELLLRRLDVDNDGSVFPRDALILINRLNARGSHILTPPSASGEGGTTEENFFYDVNGDGMLTPLDALILINHLNRRTTPAATGTAGEGEAPSHMDSPRQPDQLADACPAWSLAAPPVPSMMDQDEQAQRDAIDAELESLVEQLSHARFG